MTSDGYRMRIAGHPDAAAGFKGYIIKIRGEGDGSFLVLLLLHHHHHLSCSTQPCSSPLHIQLIAKPTGLKVDVFWDNGKVIAGYSAAPGKEDLVIAPKSAPGDAGESWFCQISSSSSSSSWRVALNSFRTDATFECVLARRNVSLPAATCEIDVELNIAPGRRRSSTGDARVEQQQD